MPIRISENTGLGLHLIRFQGRIELEEVASLVRLHGDREEWAQTDAIHVLDDDVDLSGLSAEGLDTLREAYRVLQLKMDFYVVRRSGWVCRTAHCCAVVEYWLDGRHSRDGQSTEVCLASDWPQLSELFTADEITAAALDLEFREIARIEARQTAD